MAGEIERFEIRVEEEVLEDLRRRLARTRMPDAIEGAGWDYGTDRDYLGELLRYWRDEFDWRAQEKRLNELDHYRTEIDGNALHFIHARSKHPDALPLVITHGWPGSVFEFHKIIGPLTDPERFGGSAADAFDVVCPSIPGYGFSGPTRVEGFHIRRVAETNALLMARLGYDRYGAQGGDWGAIASFHNALVAPERVCGIHLNMVVAGPPKGEADPLRGVTPEEAKALKEAERREASELGYARIQSTRPQTLAYGLNDSPAGLAAWIVEKFRSWSDCGGDVESRFTRDELLTNITIYWVTQTIGSSARLYCETLRGGLFRRDHERVEVPTGCAIFPKEIGRPPRRWAEAAFNVKQWTVMPRGGHFAALEEPELLVADIRSFFRKVR